MTAYLYPHNFGNMSHLRDGSNDAMDIESSSGESIISSARSQTLSGTGSPTPDRQLPFLPSSFVARSGSSLGSTIGHGKPIEQITTLLTCGNCSHDVILSGQLLTSKHIPVSPSSASYLLYTNFSPSTSAEESEISAYIQNAQDAIAQFDWEIARANAILETLLLEREKLAHLVKEHKALLSPWRRIPDNVLAEIFRRCEAGSGVSSSDISLPEIPDTFDPRCGPFLLSQICKQWRTQALRMPELWSTIRIRIGRGELQETCRLPLINAWLERSFDHPLTVCIVERSPRSPVYNPDSQNFAVGLLLSVANRWKRLYIVLHSKSLHWGLLANLRGLHIPLLEHCTIVTPHDEVKISTAESYPSEILITLLSGAAALKELRLDYNVAISSLQFSRRSIISLDLYTITRDRSVPVSMVFDTLRLCPNLCSLRVRSHVAGPFTPLTPLYHSCLTTLDLSIDTAFGPGAESLLGNLTPPNLTRLMLSTPETEWDQDSIMGFITRCGVIEEFRVKCEKLEPGWLLEMLDCERMRMVKVLALDLGLGITNGLLMDLSIPVPSLGTSLAVSPQSLRAPKLRSFEIGGRLFISPDDFLSFVTSRRYLSPPIPLEVEILEEIVVDCDALVYGFMSPYLVERLDELRWWGLKVRIRENGCDVYPQSCSSS